LHLQQISSKSSSSGCDSSFRFGASSNPRETGYYAWQSGNFMIRTEPVAVKPAVAHQAKS
jgi:hypothetical protein